LEDGASPPNDGCSTPTAIYFNATFQVHRGPKVTDVGQIHPELPMGATIADGKEFLSTVPVYSGFVLQFTRKGTGLHDDEILDFQPVIVEPVVHVAVDGEMIAVRVFQGNECRSMGQVLEQLRLCQGYTIEMERVMEFHCLMDTRLVSRDEAVRRF
jgi:hypothetical protein